MVNPNGNNPAGDVLAERWPEWRARIFKVYGVGICVTVCGSLIESFTGLVEYATHHGLHGWHGLLALLAPTMVDTFILGGELLWLVAVIDRWDARARWAGICSALAGLAVSVYGNIHRHGDGPVPFQETVLYAIAPLAMAGMTTLGLIMVKRHLGLAKQVRLSRKARAAVRAAARKAAETVAIRNAERAAQAFQETPPPAAAAPAARTAASPSPAARVTPRAVPAAPSAGLAVAGQQAPARPTLVPEPDPELAGDGLRIRKALELFPDMVLAGQEPPFKRLRDALAEAGVPCNQKQAGVVRQHFAWVSHNVRPAQRVEYLQVIAAGAPLNAVPVASSAEA